MIHLKNILFGIILGIANVIPAVSGGTMAVILNIYDKILFALSLKNIKSNLVFLSTLALGAVIGIFFFSKLMMTLFSSYEAVLNFCFIGMILGSIPMIYKHARFEKVKKRSIVIFCLSFAFMIFLLYLRQGDISNNSLADMGGLTVSLWFWIFFAAAVSTMAMILPGISGSFVMLLLGTYTLTIEAISVLDPFPLIPTSLGIILGGIIGIKVIKKMLRFHPQALYFSILGLVIGSIFLIFPGFSLTSEGLVSILLMLFFSALTYFFSKKAS